VGAPLTNDRVKQVKEASDIVEVVGGYVALRPAGLTFKGLCPFHDDKHPSFDVDPRRQRYRCWSCGEYGDVLSFVQKFEKLSFREALTLLARRANIPLDDHPQHVLQEDSRLRLREAVRWAAELYQQCFLDDPLAEKARRYLGERRLLGPTLRRFGVGYAPPAGMWLVEKATAADVDLDLLEKVGLIAKRSGGEGWYDRFRDRVLFPIRDPMGRPVGFGGRILPGSPLASRAPKYYNSSDTPLFAKSEQLFGLDLARTVASNAGYLAVVEGYTDVLMAHQCGVANVVATMGTALTARHVQHLRRFVPRVVLVFDADAGGDTGVDRALDLFASQEVDLAIATLPQGLDPADLLSQDGGVEQFKAVLTAAADALDFKLSHALTRAEGVEAQRQALDDVLGVIARAPDLPGQAGAVKRELIISRVSRRLALKEETVWARLDELRQQRGGDSKTPAGPSAEDVDGPRKGRAAAEERELLQLLLADPSLVAMAAPVVAPDDVRHPGLRKVLAGLYDAVAEGDADPVDLLRDRLDPPELGQWVLKMQGFGQEVQDRPFYLRQVLDAFRRRRGQRQRQELHAQINAAVDPAAALELLRQLQEQNRL
jgi:DNA primase